jgi:hypothetical protein
MNDRLFTLPGWLFAVTACVLLLASHESAFSAEQQAGQWRLATFSADVTPPLGHTLFTGGFKPASAVESPLEARGFVLVPPSESDDKAIVVCSVDWSEIRNDAYDAWRDALAEAAGTERQRVLVCAIHQHDTPLADLSAQRVLEEAGSSYQVIDRKFHAEALAGVVAALESGLAEARKVTHFGVGQAKVERISSNRRYVLEDGSVHYNRGSATKNLSAQRAPEGDIDPWLRSLSFWDGDQAVCVLSTYATHPMSYYRTGKIDADFPGIARRKRQAEDEMVFQIYASGCSGNVTAGKYNDGNPANRQPLAERLYQGMVDAWAATERHPMSADGITFRRARLRLEPRVTDGFSITELRQRIADKDSARDHCMAALGLSWHKYADDPQHRIDVPVVDFGPAALLLLPAEMYVEYQLYASEVAGPDRTVITMGYGECGPGYIPIERAWSEKDSNLGDWCWVAPGMEARIKAAIREALGLLSPTKPAP